MEETAPSQATTLITRDARGAGGIGAASWGHLPLSGTLLLEQELDTPVQSCVPFSLSFFIYKIGDTDGASSLAGRSIWPLGVRSGCPFESSHSKGREGGRDEFLSVFTPILTTHWCLLSRG